MNILQKRARLRMNNKHISLTAERLCQQRNNNENNEKISRENTPVRRTKTSIVSLNNGYTDLITTNMFPDSLYINQHPSILQRSL
jgi:hypothetical protein